MEGTTSSDDDVVLVDANGAPVTRAASSAASTNGARGLLPPSSQSAPPLHLAAPKPKTGPRSSKPPSFAVDLNLDTPPSSQLDEAAFEDAAAAKSAAAKSRFFISSSSAAGSFSSTPIKRFALLYRTPVHGETWFAKVADPNCTIEVEATRESIIFTQTALNGASSRKWNLRRDVQNRVLWAAADLPTGVAPHSVSAATQKRKYSFFLQFGDCTCSCSLWGMGSEVFAVRNFEIGFECDTNQDGVWKMAHGFGGNPHSIDELDQHSLHRHQEVFYTHPAVLAVLPLPPSNKALPPLPPPAKINLAIAVDGFQPLLLPPPPPGKHMYHQHPAPKSATRNRTIDTFLKDTKKKPKRQDDSDPDWEEKVDGSSVEEYVPAHQSTPTHHKMTMRPQRSTVLKLTQPRGPPETVVIDDDDDDDVREVPPSASKFAPAAAAALPLLPPAPPPQKTRAEDCAIVFSYPLLVGEDTVDVQVRDVEKCRNPDVFINDTIVDFYLKWLKYEQCDALFNKVLPLSCFLFTSLWAMLKANPLDRELMRNAFADVRHWMTGVNLFDYHVLIMPVNLFQHWSCAFIILDEMQGRGRILLADSLNTRSSHPHDMIASVIRSYLNHEFRENIYGQPRTKRPRKTSPELVAVDDGEPDVEIVEGIVLPPKARPEIEPLTDDEIYYSEQSMPHKRLQVADQLDAVNCGIHMLYSCEKVVMALEEEAKNRGLSKNATNLERIIEAILNDSGFDTEDAIAMRMKMVLRMEKLTADKVVRDSAAAAVVTAAPAATVAVATTEVDDD